MAERAGCGATFRETPAPAGVSSAGLCVLNGHRVDFRVQPNIDTTDPWLQSPKTPHVPAEVGPGWLFRAADLAAFNKVSARLAP